MSSFLIGVKFKETKNLVSLTGLEGGTLLGTILQAKPNVMKKQPSVDKIECELVKPADMVENEYEIYTKIELHMFISISLYFLNMQGQELIRQLGINKLDLTEFSIPMLFQYNNKKNKKRIENGSIKDIIIIYESLHSIVNFNRLTFDLYSELINILDKILFDDSKSIDIFYVKDEVYNLESLYYKQESWILELEEKHTYEYNFTKDACITLGESSDIVVYIQRYLDILLFIESKYHDIQHKKLLDIIGKMKSKFYAIENRCKNIIMLELENI